MNMIVKSLDHNKLIHDFSLLNACADTHIHHYTKHTQYASRALRNYNKVTQF